MTQISFSELEEQTKAAGYKQISALLNEENEDMLFVGHNNLLQKDRIEEVRIYSKPVYSQEQLNKLINQEDADAPIQPFVTDSPSELEEPISNHLIGFLKLGKLLTSHLNVIHGGVIATLIDEFFVKVTLPLTPRSFAVTANLNIKYMKPLKFEENDRLLDVVLECFIVRMKEHRKFKVCGYLKNVHDGYRYCKGELLVIVPRNSI
ncbi:DEKNAAC105158 [Brettanomyces naardenensis]|uniref:DEKNAAC105158 n=1 Tax=Brettanomyces naardenensis TaxID=13370 RepID=A0A448YSL7_BRENA|nr:DEKNAAC105158 [Brettanomyces naardenensis]